MGLEFLQRGLHIEVASGTGPRIRQDVPRHLAKGRPEPTVLGRHESHLVPPPTDFVRQNVVHRLPENRLRPSPANFQLRLQSVEKFDQPVVKEREARFDPEGHRVPVFVMQQRPQPAACEKPVLHVEKMRIEERRRQRQRAPLSLAPALFDSHLLNMQHRLLTGSGLRALLHYEDRNSMAFGIETRLPLLDYRLVQILYALEPQLKI